MFVSARAGRACFVVGKVYNLAPPIVVSADDIVRAYSLYPLVDEIVACGEGDGGTMLEALDDAEIAAAAVRWARERRARPRQVSPEDVAAYEELVLEHEREAAGRWHREQRERIHSARRNRQRVALWTGSQENE